MGIGIRKLIDRLNIRLNLVYFSFKNRLFGFDSANAYLRQISKSTIIPLLKKKRSKNWP